MGGSAPTFVSRMNGQQVPYGGILVTLAIYLIGRRAELFRAIAGVRDRAEYRFTGHYLTWGFIVVCQMKLRAAVRTAARSSRRAVQNAGRAPSTSWLTLAFLVGVLVLMAFDYPNGTYTLMALLAVMVMLCAGWITLKGTSPFAPTAPSYALTKLVDDNETSDPR